jgi:DNA-binding NarL/FixJ family response regulator
LATNTGREKQRQQLRAAVVQNQRLAVQGRALVSDLEQGFAALKDQKMQARQRAKAADSIPFERPPEPAPVSQKRVLLVEDHPIVCRGMAELIGYEEDLQVCGEASDVESALAKTDSLRPDLIVMDLSLKERSGLDLLEQIKARLPDQLVLVLSLHDESIYAPRALEAGASGYVMKEEATETLLRAIRKVLSGELYLSQAMETRMLKRVLRGAPALDPLKALSARELEVFRQIGQGKSTRQIAEILAISLKTVESHRSHIREKLGLNSATKLVQMAIELEHEPGQAASKADLPAATASPTS